MITKPSLTVNPLFFHQLKGYSSMSTSKPAKSAHLILSSQTDHMLTDLF